MIKNIKLKNFKCFPKMELEFSKLTVLAGANASGKSSVIQALLLASGTSRQPGSSVDVNQILGLSVGNPGALISQNPIEMPDCDFSIGIEQSEGESNFLYKIDRYSPLRLNCTWNGADVAMSYYYLNAERTGPRISYPAGFDDKILHDGSNAAYLIDQADMMQRPIPEILMVNQEISRKFSYQVEQWMNLILGDVNLSVSTDMVKASTDIKYGNTMVDQGVVPTMTGFGISYILPIVVAGLWCASIENAVLIIENPEAHLHPMAQSMMGRFLELLSFTGLQVIVETHSEHVIDGARLQAACMRDTDHIKIYFMACREERIEIQEIQVTADGELSDWPRGFFDQKKTDLMELMNIRRRNAGK